MIPTHNFTQLPEIAWDTLHCPNCETENILLANVYVEDKELPDFHVAVTGCVDCGSEFMRIKEKLNY